MLRLMRIVDRATGCIFVPKATVPPPPNVAVDPSTLPGSRRPNVYSLFTAAAGPIGGLRSNVRDIQERWLDAKDEWDAYETEQWRKEGAALRAAEEREHRAGADAGS